jgi:hypothetical protein
MLVLLGKGVVAVSETAAGKEYCSSILWGVLVKELCEIAGELTGS